MGEMSGIKDVQDAAETSSERPVKVAARPRRWGRTARRTAVALALLAGTAAAGTFGYGYWTTGRYLVSTDDAYVKADYTTIAPKVSGYVTEVLVGDNATVTAGQLLARIDDRDFRAGMSVEPTIDTKPSRVPAQAESSPGATVPSSGPA